MKKRLLQYLETILIGCDELSKKTGCPRIYFLIDFIWSAFRYGCSVRHYFLGGFWKVCRVFRKDVFTLRRMNKVMKKYNDDNYIYLLKEKNKFNEYFHNFVHRDWIYSGDIDKNEFREFLHKHNEVIIKPDDTSEGKGIRKVLSKSILQNFEKNFNAYKLNKCIIEEVAQNHSDLSFGGKALNTIRIYSFMDSKGSPHILKAILRCGTGDNIVDNFHGGGVGYEVDLETGIVISTGRAWKQENIIIHPGTKLCIIGRCVPEWENVKYQCLEAAKLIPQCRYIAWDISVTDYGVEFIEGNHDGDFDLLEFFGTIGYWKIIKQYI